MLCNSWSSGMEQESWDTAIKKLRLIEALLPFMGSLRQRMRVPINWSVTWTSVHKNHNNPSGNPLDNDK